MNVEPLAQGIAQTVSPVIEVARNQKRSRWRNHLANPAYQGGDLALSARPEKAKMDHKAMHLNPVDSDHAMEYAPALQDMIRDVEMIAAQDRKSRQKRVAMMAMQIVSVASVRRLEHRSMLRAMGQKNFLAFTRPMLDVPRVTVMTALNLLQKDQVGFELMQTSAQLMQGRSPSKPKQLSRHTLVNVVGGNPQRGQWSRQ